MKSECTYSYEEALQKLEAYCAYQERCRFEIQTKLDTLNLQQEVQQKILNHLAQHRFYDDERYTESYISGKISIKKWGRNKIKQGLFAKKIDSSLIQKYLYQIDDNQYQENLNHLIAHKLPLILKKSKNSWDTKQKLVYFLQSKGYELDLILASLKID